MSWSILFCLCVIVGVGECQIFPSLMTNATMAIVIDKEYLGDDYDNFRNKIEEFLEYAKREILRHGGIYIQMFAWPAISIKREFSALLSITSCKETWRLYRAAKRENLLHIAISEHDCARLPQNMAITIPIIETGQETPQLLLDLRTNRLLNWKHTVIIYDNFITDDLLTRVIKVLTKRTSQVSSAGISLMSLFTNASAFYDDINGVVRSKLAGLSENMQESHFIAIVAYELVEIIMTFAKELKLTNAQTQWLYVISNTNSKVKTLKRLKQFIMEGDNVAFIYNNTLINGTCNGGVACHIEETLTGFMKGLDDAIVQEFEMASQVSEEEWEAIRPTKSERTKYLLDKMKKYLMQSGSCDNCTKWKFETGETWGREYQVMETDESVAQILSVGTWRPSDGATLVDELFPHVTQGFRRKTLPLVSFHNPPWQILKTNASGDVVEFGGIVFKIINELAKNLNFTYAVEIIKSHNPPNVSATIASSYGLNETSSFMDLINNSETTTFRVPQGILELVHNKTVAMGACAYTVTEDNKKIINFTDPISIQAYKFVVARPKVLSRALLFISPFRGDTWICLSTTIISMGPILFYIHKLSPVYEYKGIRSKGGLATVQNCIWYMYGALLQQGGMHLPYADSARIIVGAWWLVVLVIGTTYCGNLVAYLTFPKNEAPITTLEDLIKRSDTISWSYSKNSFFEAQLKVSNDETYMKIYKGAKEKPNKRNMIAEIKAGRHVYIDWKIKLQYMIKQQFLESDTCDFALGSEEFSDEQIALIVAPHTPYLSRINQEIKKLHQMGLIQKWLQDYLPKKDKCWMKKRSIEVNNHTVNLDDMQGSFFVLFIGCFLSALVVGIEKCWCKKVKDKRQKKVVQPFIS
ncbi:ionotropic receptor 93a [Anthonomus grandis grandis]|uniref:ionotropic receptor 93a n=1 Tax=Anthonomus grandis grandis TaxID=2921223 RepID=UPI0021661638|nr:ionotropic receptor 93a [Anthonomus grandis grandis]